MERVTRSEIRAEMRDECAAICEEMRADEARILERYEREGISTRGLHWAVFNLRWAAARVRAIDTPLGLRVKAVREAVKKTVEE